MRHHSAGDGCCTQRSPERTIPYEYFPTLSPRQWHRISSAHQSDWIDRLFGLFAWREQSTIPALSTELGIFMLHTHTLNSQLSQVTVKFGDGSHSFLLHEGATLTDLADRIGALGTDHDGDLVSIEIEFCSPRVGSKVETHPGSPVTH